MAQYEYSIAKKVKAKKVLEHLLMNELRNQPASADLLYIKLEDDLLALAFSRQLTAQEKAGIDKVVEAHNPNVPEINERKGARVAELPPGRFEGQRTYAIDGRKQGEEEGLGTGVPVYWSQDSWRRFRDDKPVTT